MSLSKKKNKDKGQQFKIQVGDVSTYVNPYDGHITTSVATGTGSISATDHWTQKAATAVSTAGHTISAPIRSDGKTEAEKEAERLERLADMTASLENLIADFIPDEDKDVSTKIAKAVVDEIFNSGHVLPLLHDAEGYRQAESKLAQNFKNMTMEEYAKMRPKLMKGIMK